MVDGSRKAVKKTEDGVRSTAGAFSVQILNSLNRGVGNDLLCPVWIQPSGIALGQGNFGIVQKLYLQQNSS